MCIGYMPIPNYFIHETWILVFSGGPATNPLWIPKDDRVSHFVYPCICWCTVGSFPPFGYCGQCCCKHWCASIHWVPAFNTLGYTTLGELLCHMVNSVFNFLRNLQTFLQRLRHLTFPLAMHMGSDFCTSLQLILNWALVGLRWVMSLGMLLE